MKLNPIDTAEIALVAGWMAKKENYQWLDFGHGNQVLTSVSLKVMLQRDIHLLRIFTSEPDDTPIGLVALSDIDRHVKTARLWYVLGDKHYSGQGYTSRAVSKLLALGFTEIGLQAISAWAVDQNTPSIRILERNHFQLIGKQRKCHYIDGHPCDRFLFDLLACEYKEI
jgi:RimJ/RimL family protein N-acetyltransferase